MGLVFSWLFGPSTSIRVGPLEKDSGPYASTLESRREETACRLRRVLAQCCDWDATAVDAIIEKFLELRVHSQDLATINHSIALLHTLGIPPENHRAVVLAVLNEFGCEF